MTTLDKRPRAEMAGKYNFIDAPLRPSTYRRPIIRPFPRAHVDAGLGVLIPGVGVLVTALYVPQTTVGRVRVGQLVQLHTYVEMNSLDLIGCDVQVCIDALANMC